MKYIGAHVSTSGGLDKAVIRAKDLNARAFAIFTNNPLRWTTSTLKYESIHNFKDACKKFNYSSSQILPHSGYLINLGNPYNDNLKKSRLAFIDEINRCQSLGLKLLNFHPGSHLNKISEKDCLEKISDSINLALEQTNQVKLIIENTAGQGTNVGYSFEQLIFVINKIQDKNRIGVCLDTCHLFSSGYDLRTKTLCEKTFKSFDNVIGLNYLCGMHFNDSKSKFKSRIDRHHNLGKGNIRRLAFKWIIKNVNCEGIPIILETTDKKLWKEEIAWLNSL
ncbi:endonuclease IV [Buchnera aphidicola (Schlechtendalia chinensis)]|uniref:Probable endonuclease 4 n=1 Tax=Buchnera aphidicola subsp. Schlechtendalia chinensis TaxID=118110 RepID=A0A172WD93_BUCSC|nr:deoxyribonuclease IV [Buchnera aphidicola]ANF16938.1 endonuclease IV [Buchnera aphidicola (Schlechtendalia chinensis)]